MGKDYFSILELPPTATPDQIRAAYRRLAMRHHPDHNPGDAQAEDKFKQVQAAYDHLKDDANRLRAAGAAQQPRPRKTGRARRSEPVRPVSEPIIDVENVPGVDTGKGLGIPGRPHPNISGSPPKFVDVYAAYYEDEKSPPIR